MITKIRKYIEKKRYLKEQEEERAMFVAEVWKSRRGYMIACIAYSTIMKESNNSKLIEIAYDHMKVKERELDFILAMAKAEDIRAQWADIKIS